MTADKIAGLREALARETHRAGIACDQRAAARRLAEALAAFKGGERLRDELLPLLREPAAPEPGEFTAAPTAALHALLLATKDAPLGDAAGAWELLATMTEVAW
jgi:hypothetical protein